MTESMEEAAMLAASAQGRSSTTGEAPDSHLADPRAAQFLIAEHNSLMTTRALAYNEAFARAGMFLTFLSASFVAIALLQSSAAPGQSNQIAIVVLAFDLVLGLATIGRLADASAEDLRCVQGMNRIRHAYIELAPEIEPYFVTSRFDDTAGVFSTYGNPKWTGLQAFLHGMTTTPGMLGAIESILAGGFVGSIVAAAGASVPATLLAGAIGGIGTFLVLFTILGRNAMLGGSLRAPHFPSPPPS